MKLSKAKKIIRTFSKYKNPTSKQKKAYQKAKAAKKAHRANKKKASKTPPPQPTPPPRPGKAPIPHRIGGALMRNKAKTIAAGVVGGIGYNVMNAEEEDAQGRTPPPPQGARNVPPPPGQSRSSQGSAPPPPQGAQNAPPPRAAAPPEFDRYQTQPQTAVGRGPEYSGGRPTFETEADPIDRPKGILPGTIKGILPGTFGPDTEQQKSSLEGKIEGRWRDEWKRNRDKGMTPEGPGSMDTRERYHQYVKRSTGSMSPRHAKPLEYQDWLLWTNYNQMRNAIRNPETGELEPSRWKTLEYRPTDNMEYWRGASRRGGADYSGGSDQERAERSFGGMFGNEPSPGGMGWITDSLEEAQNAPGRSASLEDIVDEMEHEEELDLPRSSHEELLEELWKREKRKERSF